MGERQAFTQGLSKIHAGASIILRGSYGTAETKSRNPQEVYKSEAAQGKQQEKQIEAWAKAEDLWLNDYTDKEGNKAKSLEDLLNSQWHYINQGSEAEIYLYDDNNVIKSISLSHSNDNVAKALDKIALFNHLFPETALSIVGFGRDSLGHFRIIATQRFIQGKELSNKELSDFYKRNGLEEDGGYLHTPDEQALITDLGNYNILVDKKGNYFVIDADVLYNTPYYGGKVTFSNSFSESGNIDYDQLSVDNLKEVLHNYVDNLPENAVKSKETLHSFINSLSEKDLTDIYTDIQHNKDDVEKVVSKLRDLYKRDSSNSPTINNESTALNNNNIITINQDEYTDEFRKLQKGSLELDEDKISQFHRGKRVFTKDEQQRLGGIYERLLSSGNGNRNNKWVDLIGKGNQFKVTQVNGQLFHDIFQINRQYLPNGELVDLHDNYDNAKCYITSDGLQGFAIENNGNLVSVFSLNPANIEEKKGFLYAIKDFIKEQGATHLDCYNPSDQPLMKIYEKVFGFKPAATMDYNMEYDHDDIAKNHGNPNVVFMVTNDGEVENKHFSKDEYDKAVEYQLNNINPALKHNDNNPNNQVREVSLPNYEDHNNIDGKVTVDADWKVSLLKDLDSRISNDNTEDHNHDIIEQMEEILKAKDKEEYNNGSKKKKDEKIQKRLNGYQVLTTQMNNLIGSNLITAEEVNKISKEIIDHLSDIITDFNTEKDYAKEISPFFSGIDLNVDYTALTRKEVVQRIGINNFIQFVKSRICVPEIGKAYHWTFDDIRRAWLIKNNLDAMILLSANEFAMNEGFGIIKDLNEDRFVISDIEVTDRSSEDQDEDSRLGSVS
ncbi:MAG TPA: hypothetical protein DIS88_13205 [Prevotella sp.]|nr:hypothetical protein [Prevotella sp.]